jgi:hypothetical protein
MTDAATFRTTITSKLFFGQSKATVVLGIQRYPLGNKSNANSTTGNIAPHDFLTCAWQYWGHPEHYSKSPKKRTHVLDLSRISPIVVAALESGCTFIWPVRVCPTLNERDNLLVSHHNSGTTEQLAFATMTRQRG